MRKWFCFLSVAVLLSTVCVGAEDVLVAQAQLDGTESEDSGQDLRDCSAWLGIPTLRPGLSGNLPLVIPIRA
jgi:hypothetical protein